MASWKFNQEQIEIICKALVTYDDNKSDSIQSEFDSILSNMKLCDQKYVYVIGRPEY